MTAIPELFASLRPQFKGEILRPSDTEYALAGRVWNAAAQRNPGLIARCADIADVQAVVREAARSGVLTAVRCGGHSLAGFSTCDGGLVIDLSHLRNVSVDPNARRAHIGGGCLLGTIDTATQQAGLVFPAGVVSHTGAAGLILGGGTGWLTRLHGLSVDNVLGYTIVAADGNLVHADARENADLYWALRGGGGNFGVVVDFELKLHPLTSLKLGGGYCFGENISAVLREWRDFMPGAPDELKWNISLRLAPNQDSIPEKLRGKAALSESIVWFGGEDEGKKLFKKIFSMGNPVAVSDETIPYLNLQTMADHEFPHGRRYYTKSGYFKNLSEEIINILVDSIETIPSINTQIEFAYLGGAAGRVAAGETAFGDRSSPFIMNLLADWVDPADDAVHKAWVRNVFAKLRPAMTPGVYTNFMSGDEEDRTHEAYRERWDRLVAVKTHYDPKNVFRMNQNIPPSTTSA